MSTITAIAVRLAAERVPVGAIARCVGMPSSEVWPLLKDAKQAGEIAELPPADWPPGKKGELARAPSRPSEIAADAVPDLQRAFGLTRNEGRLLAYLHAHGRGENAALHRFLSGDLDPTTDPKLVAVVMVKLRRKIAPIPVDVVWGYGYALTAEARAAVEARLAGVRVEGRS